MPLISSLNQRPYLKNLFRAQFSKLRNWIGTAETPVMDNTCAASLINIGSGIQKLIGGTHRRNGDVISLFFLIKESRVKIMAHNLQ
jgi:hypothetical protein